MLYEGVTIVSTNGLSIRNTILGKVGDLLLIQLQLGAACGNTIKCALLFAICYLLCALFAIG